jgi:hypothetical protein
MKKSMHNILNIEISRDNLPEYYTLADELEIEKELSKTILNFASSLNFPENLFSFKIRFISDGPSTMRINEFYVPLCAYFENNSFTGGTFSFISLFYNALIQNREYLINNTNAGEIGEIYLPENKIPPEILSDFIRRLVYHGIRMAEPLFSLEKIYSVRSDNEWIRNQIEIIISEYSQDNFKIKSALDAPTDYVEQRKDSVFKQFGFLIEKIEIDKPDNPQTTYFQNTLNDINLNYCRTLEELENNFNSNLGAYFHLNKMDILLGRLNESFPMVVFNSTETIGTVNLVNIFRSLLQEQVSIKDFRAILGCLLEINDKIEYDEAQSEETIFPYGINAVAMENISGEPSDTDYVNHIRYCLNYSVVEPYLDNNKLYLIQISPLIEKAIIQKNLANEKRNGLICWLHDKYNELNQNYVRKPGFLTSLKNREKVRSFIQKDLHYIPVFCRREIPKGTEIEIIGNINEEN